MVDDGEYWAFMAYLSGMILQGWKVMNCGYKVRNSHERE